MNFNFKQILGVVMVLAALLIYAFALKPLSARNAELKFQVESDEKKVSELSTAIDSMKSAKDDLGLSSEVERFAAFRAIPPAIDQDEMIRDLIGILEENNVKMNSLSFGKAADPSGLGVLKVSAGFEGSLSQLLKFLESIEENARFLSVESISVNVRDQELGIKTANFSLGMSAYYQK